MIQQMIKKPYKITLWEDKNKIIYDENQNIQNEFLEEVCIATIGSDTMDTPIRAFNPILTEYLNGSKTFTFQIYYRYWDNYVQDFKLNPFLDLLVNERKVKLKYGDEWYDFVIKQCQESSDNKTFVYTCKDLFINELGKTGYEVELDTELMNNMGTIKELGDSILEGTDWYVDHEESDTLIQKNKEMLYAYSLPSNQNATAMIDFEYKGYSVSKGTQINIAAGEVVYIFYSCKANNENPTQFLYIPSNASTWDEAQLTYEQDSEGFIINSVNWQFDNFTIDYDTAILTPSQYFGKKVVQLYKTKYFPQIEETCTIWHKPNDDTDYYCYTELEYASVAEIQNMISNNTNYLSTNGWVAKQVSENNYVVLSDITAIANDNIQTLTVKGEIYNTGFYDNRAALAPNGFINGESYILAYKLLSGAVNEAKITITNTTQTAQEETLLTFNNYSGTIPGELTGYTLKKGNITKTINYDKLIGTSTSEDSYENPKLWLKFNNESKLQDCYVFKERYDNNGKLIVPNLEDSFASVIQTRYNFFIIGEGQNDLNEIFGKEDLNLYESTLNPSEYIQQKDDTYEKVTSITGSKSNRFNLIQSLCEAFECWAKFIIEHDKNGKTLYSYEQVNEDDYVEGGRYYQRIDEQSGSSSDDSIFKIYTEESYPQDNNLYEKVFAKKVVFKEFIGKDNWAGFRYGINLKSIQRNIVSDQIATKVIVKANTNEFAPNGSCSIQEATLNPTGENALYNFQYYLNHGLLDYNALYDDLYGTNGGLGFIINMRYYNDLITTPIEQLTLVAKTLNELKSRQTVYDALISEADGLIKEISAEIIASGYGLTGEAPDYVKTLRNKRQTYINMKDNYETVSARNRNGLIEYSSQYEGILSNLTGIMKKKEKLNDDFENKYFGYIQEGTWNSNDYYDPELYYEAANVVLYTSSFPQISYTINVLELSQVDGYESYTFAIADRTYIEDTEFFGYDQKGRPYKEEIIISQVKYNLDDPSQNTITVQNYKTQFQDLFQRIAATSQSLQYNEGAYNRAAMAVNGDKTFDTVLLQNSLKANEIVIQNALNQSVSWDDTGITVSNFLNASEILRLTSGGIVLSTDGGQTWTTGITGNGINAKVITTGQLDTSKIRIFADGMETFEWNAKGISAFAWNFDAQTGNPTTVNYNQFVRFDQYGLYGINNGQEPSNISDVINNSVFSLTWKGLHINMPSGQGFSIVSDPSGNPKNQGWYEYNNSTQTYEKTTDTVVNFSKTYYENNDILINVNNAFTVDGAGNINATSGSFSGTLASGVSINSPTITGGTINIGNGNFVVDSYGNVTSKGQIVASKLQTKKNGVTVDIIKYVDANTSNFDITSAIGDFSGSFSGTIYTDELKIYNDSNVEYGMLSVQGETPGLQINSYGAGRFIAQGSIYLSTMNNNSSSTYILLKGAGEQEASIRGDVTPSSNGIYDIGASTLKWNDIYAVNGSIQTSDKKEKKDISYNLTKYENFIKELKPVSYKFLDGHRDHIGFIAQDVEDSLIKTNISTEEFAGFIKTYNEDTQEYNYSLRYSEFIALQQWQIQKLESRIAALENLTSSLNSDIL